MSDETQNPAGDDNNKTDPKSITFGEKVKHYAVVFIAAIFTWLKEVIGSVWSAFKRLLKELWQFLERVILEIPSLIKEIYCTVKEGIKAIWKGSKHDLLQRNAGWLLLICAFVLGYYSLGMMEFGIKDEDTKQQEAHYSSYPPESSGVTKKEMAANENLSTESQDHSQQSDNQSSTEDPDDEGKVELSFDVPEFILAAAVLFIFLSIVVFTRPLLQKADNAASHEDGSEAADESNPAVNVLFRMGYGFIVATVCFMSFLVFTDEFIVTKSHHEGDGVSYKPHVVGVLLGCDYEEVISGKEIAAGGTETAIDRVQKLNGAMPMDAHCGQIPPQWVISIGGNILDCKVNGDCPYRYPGTNQNSGMQGHEQLNPYRNFGPTRLANELTEVRQAIVDKKRKKEELQTSNVGLISLKALKPDLADSFMARVEEQKLDIGALKYEIEQLETNEKEINEEIAIQASRPQIVNAETLMFLGKPIVGGLVVPVYFVVIAILGSLISMSRKLPEYQRRVTSTYRNNFNEYVATDSNALPPMTAPQVRESIIFQIVQVCFSFGVALLAYSYVEQEALGANVLLAFAAGFSSEIFLKAVRAFADRVVASGPQNTIVPDRKVVLNKVKVPLKPVAVTPTSSPIDSSKDFNVGDACVLTQAITVDENTTLSIGQQGVITAIEENNQYQASFQVVDGEQTKQVTTTVPRDTLAHPEEVAGAFDDLKG